jgi:hypothetical protein
MTGVPAEPTPGGGSETGGGTWRTGRKVRRTIYAQLGSFASDDDRLIGTMDTPELAAQACAGRNAARTMGTVVTALSRSLKAAYIELAQGHPEAAAQWIASAVPGEVWDGDQWDGTESAQQWADRTDPEVPHAG